MNINILKFFAHYIESQLGIIYTDANYFQLEHRLKDISSLLGFAGGLEELFEVAQKSGINGQMKLLLLDLATNNETSFFRDVSIFKALSSYIFPEVIKKDSVSKISLWSAASSAGQEVYSILMEYLETKEKLTTLPELNILATDVSEAILKRAEAGVYSQLEAQRGLPAKLLIKYFDKKNEDQWQVKRAICNNISFKKINLLHEFEAIGPFDIVFCRNVLIYQNVENKKIILKKIHDKMKSNGFLVLGAAESLFGLTNDFEQIAHEGAIFYRRKL